MSEFTTIPAVPGQPEPTPPTSGNWVRNADGSLTPADAETQATAFGTPPAPAETDPE